MKLNKLHINLLKYPLFAGSSKETSLVVSLNDAYKQESAAEYHMLKVSAECTEKVKNPSTVFNVKTNEMVEYLSSLEVPIKTGEEITIKIRAQMP